MPLGRPFSQLLGEFHGRTDMLSGSAVAQPPRIKTTASNSSRLAAERRFQKRFTIRDSRE